MNETLDAVDARRRGIRSRISAWLDSWRSKPRR
jgi:hypothetical protein